MSITKCIPTKLTPIWETCVRPQSQAPCFPVPVSSNGLPFSASDGGGGGGGWRLGARVRLHKPGAVYIALSQSRKRTWVSSRTVSVWGLTLCAACSSPRGRGTGTEGAICSSPPVTPGQKTLRMAWEFKGGILTRTTLEKCSIKGIRFSRTDEYLLFGMWMVFPGMMETICTMMCMKNVQNVCAIIYFVSDICYAVSHWTPKQQQNH